MFFIYQVIVTLLIFISPIIIIFRIFKNKEDKIRFLEKFSLPTKKNKGGNLIWFHGASVGEILSIVPLIKNYEENKSIKQILITSSTLSSSKVLSKYNFKKTIHQFYPIDHIYFTKKFLNYWKPKIAIFVESEIWPCMYNQINEKNIPLILLNARLTKKTFQKWMKIKFFSKKIFDRIKVVFPQNNETKFFLKKISRCKIKFLGNLKFSEIQDKKLIELNKKLKIEFKKNKIWIASSTHKNEEIFCVKAHLELKKKFKNLITIIIPRHIHRTQDIINDIQKLNLKVALHSNKIKTLQNVDIYLVDTFGETKKFHNLGSSVFLGGSIINKGGQNPLEAARTGSRILHGPHTDNFKDIYNLLKKFKISKKINSPSELASSIVFKKNKNIGSKIKKMGEKILKETIKELDFLIKNEIKKT
tara:strand:+ start:1777 stop:3027 length:1251 start_codon:yes stop_codon:yes gene_type:complete